MILICPDCKQNIKLSQQHFYHAGFNDVAALYCNKCFSTLVLSSFNKKYQQTIKDKHPFSLNKKEKTKVEKLLKSCSCGGRFKFDDPRCSICKGSLSPLLPSDIYYIEIGNVINSEKDKIWKN